MKLRVFDFVMLAISLGITALSAIPVVSTSPWNGQPSVEIKTTHGTYVYPLNQNRDLYEPGPAGVTWLRIHGGKVYAVNSPGPRKIMMRMGKISRDGEWLASVPNHVFVLITGGKPSTLDAHAF
ncbi:MAG: hypothetical protein HKM05_07890 [Spirochaetales bacterium]|nr:hypothetical protein [Spirochaetales bacterium]